MMTGCDYVAPVKGYVSLWWDLQHGEKCSELGFRSTAIPTLFPLGKCIAQALGWWDNWLERVERQYMGRNVRQRPSDKVIRHATLSDTVLQREDESPAVINRRGSWKLSD
jgi:hypothetical protein